MENSTEQIFYFKNAVMVCQGFHCGFFVTKNNDTRTL